MRKKKGMKKQRERVPARGEELTAFSEAGGKAGWREAGWSSEGTNACQRHPGFHSQENNKKDNTSLCCAEVCGL